MDYSSSSLCSFASVDRARSRGSGTLCLFDDSPVREIKKMELHTPSSIETGVLLQELNRVNVENKRLTEMLTVVCENYNELKRQLTEITEYMSKSASNNNNNNNNNNEIGNVTKKRKVENNTTMVAIYSNNNVPIESCSSDEEISCEKMKEEAIQAKITRVAVRTEASDSTLILKDGYQWRKYGQKVTRDNPCPRAYFKCSFAPSCPVKKKVQRSLEDQTMLVATYEGEHNHAPLQQEGSPGASRVFNVGSVPCNATLSPSGPTVTLDLTKAKSNLASDNVNVLSNTATNQLNKFNSGEFQKLLAEHMASSLTKDPSFKSALAAAISGRIAHQSLSNY